jgi:adenylate cyclase
VLFSPESLAETFSSGTNESILINAEGDILISNDQDSFTEPQNIKGTKIYNIISESKARQQQLVYKGNNNSEYFASFYKLLSDEITIITQIQDNIVFEALQTALRRNLWLELALLFTAILIVWFISKTISVPIEELTSAVKKIEQGQFEVSIKRRTHDELSVLAESIEQMGQGLAERDRLKETFGRFINTELAERATRGELKLGGENRKATISFADIRCFTEKAEKMTPENLVAFLNRYLERMVECVTQTGGCVDKFIGDAIMAVWGAPLAGESPKADALSAITTALMMRNALIKLNEEENKANKEPIQFGCGISSGDVTAGQIGSKERMEYTVIGDTVNLASRIESINKLLCTDILISEQTFELVKDDIIAEEMPSVSVKGKSQPIRIFAVIALKNTVGTPLADFQQVSTLKEELFFLFLGIF